MSKFIRNDNGYTPLNNEQKKLISEEINRLVINKQHSHPSDLDKVAGLFYNIANSGFLIQDHIIENIMKNSGKNWGESLFEDLESLANDATSIVSGRYEMDYSEFVNKLKTSM